MQSTERKALDWPDEANGEVGVFLSFLDPQIDAHPEWIAPADEAQLDRLARLLSNQKIGSPELEFPM